MIRRVVLCLAVSTMVVTAIVAAIRPASPAPGHLVHGGDVLLDSDMGRALFGGAPLSSGESRSRCIRVTRDGSTGEVRLFGRTGGTGLDRFLRLTVVSGSQVQPDPSCGGFHPDGTLFAGTLHAFPDRIGQGISDPKWGSSGSRGYRFTVTLVGGPASEGLTARQSFVWEARTP